MLMLRPHTVPKGVTEFPHVWGLGLVCCGAHKDSFAVSPPNSDTSSNADKLSSCLHAWLNQN